MNDVIRFITDIWNAIGGWATVGGVCGLIALLQTSHANQIAKKANGMAHEAARDANTANKIAAEANQISANANAISQHALDVSKDQIVYLWDAEFDCERLVCSVVNQCPYKAEDTVVLFFHNECDLIGGTGAPLKVPGFGHLDFHSTLFGDYLREAAARRLEWEESNGDSEMPALFDIQIYVSWTSEGGVHRSYRFQKSFSEIDRIDRLDR
ncbi:hypothetical protein [Bifidobacterium aerophilum]|uniref:Uncharacterized protein n=1 Tax=Bifidobacterium aerophilum TaxID=1798155 RepID=A0A6N9Z6R0_9BIFI|nr:hypothetical protein [Bifidobacterium aerophilum]NEG89793.1 hypothetical protein [Bifidobacterium aerophilum]